MDLRLTCHDVQSLLNQPSSHFTSTTPLPTLLRVMTLPPGASTRDIKRRYKELALACHPDKCVDDEKEFARAVFQQLQHLMEAINGKIGDSVIDLTLSGSDSDSADSEATAKIESTDARLHGLYVGAVFPSKQSLLKAVEDYSSACGFLFTQQLDSSKPDRLYYKLLCNRSGKTSAKKEKDYDPPKRKRQRRSLKVGCPWKVTAKCEIKGIYFICLN